MPPAAGDIRLPAYRLKARRLTRRVLELAGHLLHIRPRLLRIVPNHLKKPDTERVLLLQADEEMEILEVRLNLLQALKNEAIVGVGAIDTGQIAGVVEQIRRMTECIGETGRRPLPRGARIVEQLLQALGGIPKGSGDLRAKLTHRQHRPQVRVDDERRETGENEASESRLRQGEGAPPRPRRRQVRERQRQAGLQAGRAVSRKRLKGQNRDKLTEKHQREQKRKV